jgi:hypothetical protein
VRPVQDEHVVLRRKRQQVTSEASASLFLQCCNQPYCTVIFEPYGSEYQLLGEEDWLRVVVGGGGEVEVVHRPDSILLWPSAGWEYLDAVNRAGERPTGLF